MKLKLTLALLAPIENKRNPFVSGFAKLCEHPWKGDTMAHFIEALSEIEARNKALTLMRGNLIKKYGEKKGEDWAIDPMNTAALNLFFKRLEEYQNLGFTIRLVKPVEVPESIELSVFERRALQEAGVIKPLDVPKPGESETEAEPETLPRNGELKARKPKPEPSRLND